MRIGSLEIDDAKVAELCGRYQVAELALFGSAARRETRPESDIDLLVQFQPSAQIGLLDYAGLMLDLEARPLYAA